LVVGQWEVTEENLNDFLPIFILMGKPNVSLAKNKPNSREF